MFSRLLPSRLHPWLGAIKSLIDELKKNFVFVYLKKSLVLNSTIGTPLLDGALLPWGVFTPAFSCRLKEPLLPHLRRAIHLMYDTVIYVRRTTLVLNYLTHLIQSTICIQVNEEI